MKTRYLIIGASAGAVSAVEAIRALDNNSPITVISDEVPAGYSRPMISEFLAGEADMDKIMFRDETFWRRNKVRLIYGEAFELNPYEKTVKVSKNQSAVEIEYEKLLLATGGKAIIPNIEGLEEAEKLTFTTLKDAKKLSNKLAKINSVAVIGGGLIGVSLAEALIKLGKKVTIVELKSHILPQVLDEKASSMVEENIRKAGVNVKAGHTVAKVYWKNYPEELSYIELDDGERIPCQQVVMAIGVSPRIELALKAGIDVNRGIIIDERMETSSPGIYACGDAAELYDFIYEMRRPIPLWPVARWTGKTAGYNMAGFNYEFQSATAMSALKYFNIPIITVGLVNPTNQEEYEVKAYLDPTRKIYRKIVVKDEHLVGFILLGEISSAGILYHLTKNHINVRKVKGKILTQDFGLTYLPKRVRGELLRR